MRILFTDGIGAAVLTNGKPAPANRAANFKPSAMAIGDEAFRQSDGAKTKIRYRDDFGCTFDLVGIPVAGVNQNLLDVVGDIAGTVGSTPTSVGTSGPAVTVAIARSTGVPGGYGYNGLVAKHVDAGTGGGAFISVPGAVVGHVYQFSAAIYVPTGSTATDPRIDLETGTSGSTVAHADLTKRDQWQLLTVTATATATSILAVVYSTGPAAALVFSDLWTVVDLTAPTLVRPVDLAERLAYWLENGGTCQVEMGDLDNNIYTTCGVLPGAKIQPPTLSDKRFLEYTLSLALVNLAASPARMRCHYL